MKRVLFIVNSLGKGGGERVVANLANQMVKNHKVDIITLYKDDFYKVDNRINLYNLSIPSGKIKKFTNIKKYRNEIQNLVEGLENNGRYDLITIHLPMAHLICNKTEFINRSYLVIHTVYSKKLKSYFRTIGKYILKKIYNNKNIITVSDGVNSEFVNKFNINTSFIKTIYNPIDLNDINKKSKEKLLYDKDYILFVGRLTKIKNCDLLIKSYNKTSCKEKYNLVIIGDGNEKESLVKLAEDLKLTDKVIFKGWQENPYKWMENAEMLVVCSEYEAFPMSILETLACNTKVVSVDCDYGPREILKGDISKFLIDSYKEEDIAKVIDLAIDNYPQDRYSYAKQYDINNITQQYLEVGGQVE